MANCIDCNVKLGFLNTGTGGRCTACTIEYGKRVRTASPDDAKRSSDESEANARIAVLIENVLLTTECSPSIRIVKRLEIVTAEVAYGMNIFKDLFSGVRDIIGGRSEAVQSTMRQARRTALYELKREAHAVGANAVVGVDLDFIELSSAGSMVMLVASGTAVVIEQ